MSDGSVVGTIHESPVKTREFRCSEKMKAGATQHLLILCLLTFKQFLFDEEIEGGLNDECHKP